MADEAINICHISKTKLDLGMPPRLALAHARQLDTSNMECELAVDSSAFEGIMFSRKFGLQPWANSYPAGEKSASIMIGTQLQYFETTPQLDIVWTSA